MTPNEYIVRILNKYAVPRGNIYPAERNANAIAPLIRQWAGAGLSTLSFSGSYAKGTGILGTTDIDLFISLKSDITSNLKDIYESLYKFATSQYWFPRRQNVSIGITINGTKIDLVPARVQPGYLNYHSLYTSKKNTWTQTNVSLQIDRVKNSGRINEIRAIKIWRNLHSLDFPSFFLELMVIEALYHHSTTNLSANVMTVLKYISNSIISTRIIDPSNTNNVISNDLTIAEKSLIASQATRSCQEQYWEKIIW